jgi:hypothetical protein
MRWRQNTMADLLRRLQGAVPRVERWIDDLHTSHRGESVRTSDLKFRRLAAHFPASLLTSTSVALGSTPIVLTSRDQRKRTRSNALWVQTPAVGVGLLEVGTLRGGT